MKEKLITKILSSFDNHSMGFSGRKLSAFTIIGLVVLVHLAWLWHAISTGDFKYMPELLGIDFFFIAVMFGLTTYQSVQNKNNEANSTTINSAAGNQLPNTEEN